VGLTATLSRLSNAIYKKKDRAPGDSILASSIAAGGEERTPEIYSAPGVVALPGDGTQAVQVYLEGRRVVVVATYNYKIKIDLLKGETAVFSTDAAGDIVKAKAVFKVDGTIELNGGTKTFVTHAELNTALQTFITALNLHVHGSAGTPPVTPMSLNIAGAATTTIKTGG
jgi:hypothetical protein